MKKSFLLCGILIFAFIGIADSWYLAEAALSGAALVCDTALLNGCNAVAQSPYSRLLGIPFGVYGTFFYASTFVLGAVLTVSKKRLAFLSLYYLSMVGFIASMVFVLIQMFLIQDTCVYCIISAVLATLIFALARSLVTRFAPPKLAVVG